MIRARDLADSSFRNTPIFSANTIVDYISICL